MAGPQHIDNSSPPQAHETGAASRLERGALRAIGLLEGINEWSGRAVAWLTLAMVAVTFAVVILRYAFNVGWIAMQESVTFMHALVFLVGAAYTLRHEGHVRVDIFYRAMGERGRAWVDLLGALLLLAPVAFFIGWESWDYVAVSWARREASGETGGLPGIYLLKSTILLMSALLLAQGLAQMLRSLLILAGRPAPAPGADGTPREL